MIIGGTYDIKCPIICDKSGHGSASGRIVEKGGI